jgi:SNF2 family DNA or RNA helicase
MEETSLKTPEIRALQILEDYEGSNNFILNLKHKKFNSKTFTPTRSQSEYIINYQNTKPKVAKKWVKLDSYFAKKLKEDKMYTKEPTEIYVEKLLVEKDKSYHIWGKIFSGETIYDFWLPKTALLKDNEVKNVVIDYEKYNHRAPMSHQKEAIEKLVRNKKFILADDMGLGKTTSTIISALETGAKKILIICPASLKINWQREIANYSDRSVFLAEGKKFSSDSDFVIVNYDILKNFHDIKDKDNSQILKSNFDLMIADECFTYETTVMTDVGEIKIGDIVENNLDVNVLTYNHVTKKTEYKKIFRWLKKSKDTIYQIKLQNGVFIECTGNHKFFTKNRGYVRADQLTKNDDLYELSKGINKTTSMEGVSNLFSVLRNNIQVQKNHTSKKRKKTKVFQKLHILWKKNEIPTRVTNEKTKLLFPKLLKQIEMEDWGYETKMENFNGKTQYVGKNERSPQEKSKFREKIFRKNEKEQSYVKPKNRRKNEKKIKRKNFFIKRWEWKNNTTTGDNLQFIGGRLGYGVTYPNKGVYWKSKVITKFLQSRHWKFVIKNYYRNRWEITHNKEVEILRQKENRNINFVRMESITILERGSYDKSNEMYSKNTRVYDLEIKDNHNYFVNGILVSNCHYVSNPQSNRTKIVNEISKNINRVWLLTGTPMTNRPMNYYNLLNLVDSPVAANWMAYAKRYCNGYQFSVGKRKVWNVTGASNLEELRERTQTHILRRLKEDVLDLPDKIITPVYLRLKSKDYEELMGEYYEWYDKNQEESSSLTIQFGKLMKVRKVIAQEKVKSTIELAENIIEQGKKVIIFTNFTDTLQEIYNHFGKSAVYLDGSCSKPHRQKSVDDFQENDKIKVFVGNLKAAGVGITLTSAEAVIMNDLSFVPAEHSQAEDRSHRIGQKNSTSVYYPLFENTIEGAIYDILTRKKKIISTVMGDDMLDDASTIEEMLNMISSTR